MAMEIIRNEKVSAYKKSHVLYSFFLVRKVVAHMVTFFFYCVVMPTTVFFPEVEVPKWRSIYIPSVITILNATPGSMHLVMIWIVFENVMAMHRAKGALIGLLEVGRENEWVVTEKLGDAALKMKSAVKVDKKLPRARISDRIHLLELGVGAYIFFCACYEFSFGKYNFYIYLFLQAISFFVVGFGCVGTIAPTS